MVAYRIPDLTAVTGAVDPSYLIELSDSAGGTCYFSSVGAIRGVTQNLISAGGTYGIGTTVYPDTMVSTTAPVTFNLPDSTLRAGAPIVIADLTGVPNITINTFGSQTFLGQTTFKLTAPFGSLILAPVTFGSGGWYPR